jgi:hypothetical protein
LPDLAACLVDDGIQFFIPDILGVLGELVKIPG